MIVLAGVFFFQYLAMFMPGTAFHEPEWILTWQDEFNYSGLPDSTKWSYESGMVRNEEKQYYTVSRLKNTHVRRGHLILEAHAEPMEGHRYTSSSLHTKTKFEMLYGRIDIRAKLPGCRGILTAFWMLPTTLEYGDYLKSGEIDIMECVGFDPNTIHCTIHTQAYNEGAGNKRGEITELPYERSPQSQFHVYSLVWYPDTLKFLVDDSLVFQFLKENNSSDYWPFDKHFYLLISMAVGGVWAGRHGIAQEEFPQRLIVDYVRAYALRNRSDLRESKI